MTAVPPARPNGDALLTSLAIINVNWEDNRQSYLDNFVPFAIDVMRRAKQDDYSVGEVKERLVEVFGLDLPTGIVDSLLGRATRQHVLARDNKRYRFTDAAAKTDQHAIARLQADLGRRHSELVSDLVNYAKERFDLDWTSEAAEEALLSHVEKHAIPLLASVVEGRSYAPHQQDKQGRDYIVSTFVIRLVESDQKGFEHIEALVKGCMLASALYVGSPGNTPRKFRDTTLYLDTPVCLKALGHEGPEAQRAVQDTLRLAMSQNAKLACFAHNLREIEGVLESAKAALKRAPGSEGYTRGVQEHFHKCGFTESDINAKIARLEQDLESLRINILERPEHEIAATVNELELEELMQDRVGYARRGTLEYDLDSLTAIHRLRGGISSQHLETCKAVLVTDNYPLVGAARSYFKRESHRWPVAMPEHELAALVWVKEPLSAPDLPKQQIIADCYAALAPTQSHWERIVGEIQRLRERGDITEDEVGLLIHSNEAQRSLMDTTLGDPNKVNEGAIRTALESTRHEIGRPAHEAREEAIQRAASAEAAEVAERFEREQAEGESRELRNQIERIERERAKDKELQRKRVESHANKIAKRWERAALAVGAVVVGFGLLSPLIPAVKDWFSGWAAWVLSVVIILVAAAAGVALLNGWNLKQALAPLRERLRRHYLDRGLSERGINPEDAKDGADPDGAKLTE